MKNYQIQNQIPDKQRYNIMAIIIILELNTWVHISQINILIQQRVSRNIKLD